MTPFEKILGSDIDKLPAPVRHWHSLRTPARAEGRAAADVTSGLLPALICRIAGLPKAGQNIPVSVTFTPLPEGGEHWARTFAERRYASRMRAAARSLSNDS